MSDQPKTTDVQPDVVPTTFAMTPWTFDPTTGRFPDFLGNCLRISIKSPTGEDVYFFEPPVVGQIGANMIKYNRDVSIIIDREKSANGRGKKLYLAGGGEHEVPPEESPIQSPFPGDEPPAEST